MFSEEELKSIGGYYRDLFYELFSIRQQLQDAIEKGGGTFSINGLLMDYPTIIQVMSSFCYHKPLFDSRMEFCWTNIGDAVEPPDILDVAKAVNEVFNFVSAIPGARIPDRPEAVSRLLDFWGKR